MECSSAAKMTQDSTDNSPASSRRTAGVLARWRAKTVPGGAGVERGLNAVSCALGLSALVFLEVSRLRVSPAASSSELAPTDWLVSSTVSPLLAALLLVVGAGIGASLPLRAVGPQARRRLLPLAAPLLIPGLAWLFLFPTLVGRLRILSAFHGRLLCWLLLISGSAMVWEWGARAGFARRLDRVNLSRWLWPVAFGFFFLVGVSTHERVGLSGDEPHYLIITQSLVVDGDLAVENNYRQRHFESFYQGKIGAHLAIGTPYSVHGILLPLLLYPGFRIAGLIGVALVVAGIGAVVVREVFVACFSLTRDKAISLASVLAFGLSIQGIFQSTAVYPELVAALMVALTVRRLVAGSPMGSWSCFAFGLAIGILPLAHVKFMPLSGLLLVAMAVGHRARIGSILTGGLLGSLAVVGVGAAMTGSLSPIAGYGRQRVFVDVIPRGLAGLWFDQESGLLALSPFFALGLVGVVCLWHRRRAFAMFSGVLVLGVSLVGAAHPLWSGGSSAPARFLFPVLPVLTVAAAAIWAWSPLRQITTWARTLVLVTVGLGLASLILPDQPLHLNGSDGSARVLEALSMTHDLSAYFPSVARGDSHVVLLLSGLFCFVVLAFLTSFDSVATRGVPRRAAGVLFVGLLAWLQPSKDQLQASDRALAARWVEGLSTHQNEVFVSLHSGGRFSGRELASGLRVRPWTVGNIQPIRLPAGRYRLTGDNGAPREAWELCNGEGCWSQDEAVFEVGVDMLQFHPAATGPVPAIESQEMAPAGRSLAQALRSLALDVSGGSAWLHGLDDAAYLDPRRFWTRGTQTARFALEAKGDQLQLVVGNGPSENWVELDVELPEGRGATSPRASGAPDRGRSPKVSPRRFRLRPHETRAVSIPLGREPTRFSVRSAEAFRPSTEQGRGSDNRTLGVFLSGFDLSR